MKMLCDHLMRASAMENDDAFLQHMIQLSTKIIRSRKTNCIHQPNITEIDQFPSCLIGEIASCLDQESYARFSRTNRAIFASCNMPNTLRSIDAYQGTTAHSIRLQNYPKCTRLTLDLDRVGRFDMTGNQNAGCRLNSLSLLGVKPSGARSGDAVAHSIDQFIKVCKRHLDLRHLNYTSICGLSEDQDCRVTDFLRLLSQFSATTFLELHSCGFSGDEIDDEELRGLFPNLTKLCLAYMINSEQWLRVFGAQLTSLDLDFDFAQLQSQFI